MDSQWVSKEGLLGEMVERLRAIMTCFHNTCDVVTHFRKLQLHTKISPLYQQTVLTGSQTAGEFAIFINVLRESRTWIFHTSLGLATENRLLAEEPSLLLDWFNTFYGAPAGRSQEGACSEKAKILVHGDVRREITDLYENVELWQRLEEN